MKRSLCKILCLGMLVCSMAACSNSPEAVSRTCDKLLETSRMTDNCAQLAENLQSQIVKLNDQVTAIEDVQDAQLQQEYVKALGACMVATFEIKAGPCGQNEDVVKALEIMDKHK